MSKTFLYLLTALLSFSSMAQGYEIEVTAPQYPNDTIYLVNYFGKRLYYADTAATNKKGVALFSGERTLPGGKYSVMMKTGGTHLFEVLIAEQNFEMHCDTLDKVGLTTFKNSPTNQLYYDYINFISDKKKEVALLNEEIAKDSVEMSKTPQLMEQIQAINVEVKEYQAKMMADNPDNWAARLVGMSIPLEVPEAPKDENGVVTDSLFQYNWYIAHYWDNIPLKDSRIVRTPEYDRKLDDYMNKALMQVPDTLNKYADLLLEEVSYDADLFKFTLHFITYNLEKSKIMGHDASFVHIVDNYYKTGRAEWLDEKALDNIIDKADRLKPVLLGKPAPPVYLRDPGGQKVVPLYDVDAEYTVLYVWDPDCGHCKKENPKVVDLQNKYMDRDVKVYAIGNPHENEKWLEYLEEHPEFGVLINVSDAPEYPSMFRTQYDIHSTPVVMLLDKDKKIVAKQIGIDQLDQMIEKMLDKAN